MTISVGTFVQVCFKGRVTHVNGDGSFDVRSDQGGSQDGHINILHSSVLSVISDPNGNVRLSPAGIPVMRVADHDSAPWRSPQGFYYTDDEVALWPIVLRPES